MVLGKELHYIKNPTRGYLYVSLSGKQFRLNRLVALVYLPNPHNLPVVMHLDNNIYNNCYKNLKLGTYKENIQQMMREGRNRGQFKPTITKQPVNMILEKYNTGNYSQIQLTRLVGLKSQGRISRIINKYNMSGWNRKLQGLETNTEETIHSLEFATSQEAWERLNEAFLRLDPVLFEKGATANSGVAVVYNVFIKIRKAWVDPEFDYGRCFNYKETKWTSLLNNYIDFNKLDLLRSKLRVLKNKYNQNYNVTYMFNNHHNNGKQCLIAATFSKRFGEDIPVITMVIRASEITKRLIFDFLLIQRMAEYVYGPEQSVQINLFATQIYGNVETLLMYHTHKPLRKILKGVEENPWINRVNEIWKKFKNGQEKDFSSFKVFFRSFKVLRPDLYEETYKSMKAKELLLEYEDIEYPENVISYSQRKAYKKKLLKQQKKNEVI